MRPKYHYLTYLSCMIFLLCNAAWAQKEYEVKGNLKDANSNEPLIGATIYIKETLVGTTSDDKGNYALKHKQGQYTIVVSYLGYELKETPVLIDRNLKMNIAMKSSAIKFREIVIEGDRSDENVTEPVMGVVKLDMKEINKIPSFMGEIDLLKSIQLLPGVQSAGDGNSGFYVRGGGPDQNLVLFDDAPVYNSSHLFGFFSIFNGNAVDNIELIKGGMPAQYGGRLSSVLDVTAKSGNKDSLKVQGGIGLISSRLTLEGPIIKDKTSFTISARRTYVDVVMRPFLNGSNFDGTAYYFYDLNGKVHHTIDDKNEISLSGYFGRDVFTYKRNTEYNNVTMKTPWGNSTASLVWKHQFNDKLHLKTAAIFSDYHFNFQAFQERYSFGLSSGIRDWNAKADLYWRAFPNHEIKTGGIITYHTFSPSNVEAIVDGEALNTGEVVNQYALESAFYISDQITFNEVWSAHLGLRYSQFTHLGPFSRYEKDDRDVIVDTVNYVTGEKVASYSGFEPRATVKFSIDEQSSIKANYTFNYQYIHLASLSAQSLPTDIWVASSDLVEPQRATQYGLGYFKNFDRNRFETSVELYYKEMTGLVEYREGTQPANTVADNPDNNFTFGTGYSYGVELFAKKRYGDLSGWIGYTWSRTMRQFDDLSDGNEFPAKFDRTHDLSVVGMYTLNEKWEFGSTFVYATGNSITLPESRYIVEGRIVDHYGQRNGYRMRSYNRLDVSVTYHVPQKRKIKSSWTLSVFNVYSRANPYFIYFDNLGSIQNGDLTVQAIEVSLFPIIPSITWNFEF